MGPKTQELIEVLDKLIDILTIDEQIHWSQWMGEAKSLILASDIRGIDKVIEAYGGMGSFNDVQIKAALPDKESLNQLRNAVWTLANAIKRDVEAEP